MQKDDNLYHDILDAVREASDDEVAIDHIRELLDATDEEKEEYLDEYDEEGPSRLSEDELARVRRYVEDLCAKDSELALRIKGYACYTGDCLYEQDWEEARKCFDRLVETTDNPEYANTLGYIYYYGRTTGGVPDYEKALPLFRFGAIHGIHESLYKLCDMYRNGYTVKKRPGVAFSLYRRVYLEARKEFFEWQGGNFADAALRMGDAYRYSIGVEPDPLCAYECYLEADYAARKRVKQTSFFGARVVADNAAQALHIAKEQLPPGFFQKQCTEKYPDIIRDLVEDGLVATIAVQKQKGGAFRIFLERQGYPFLFVRPELGICRLTQRVQFTGIGGKTSFKKKDGAVAYDSVEWNGDRVELYLAKKRVGWLACKKYRIYAPDHQPKHGKRLRFARITFQRGGKRYDYLCDDKDVKAGDTVIVPGMNGNVPVHVTAIVHMRMSELPLPFDRYKHVVRKAET